ncbi:MAG: DEAD/DEAH box helicase [Candidatus Calescibacterium sp.]|nr:DEAD/DEAH box helicase [Candidatus Calescibacterium sp.]MCX7734405.1 DEAD/DEAH box helicase [bacterium]MDW8086831.1 DEAD/DEAH box helicase [Candidatus Calescibacterium sp.]
MVKQIISKSNSAELSSSIEFILKQKNVELDDFQKEAIDYLQQGYDVLISAPTGSGKTLIAEIRIHQMLQENKKVWYASPIKALSNDKYRDFRKLFSQEFVGILTGDRKENTKAPVIVGTTEIFRNILIEQGLNGDIDVSLIVFDEAHWIKDRERGVSWEEAIIFSPKHTQLLLLSATFPNIEEIALWISKVREKEVKVVYKLKRPVPLIWFSIGKSIKPLFRGEVSDELTKINYEEINLEDSKFSLINSVKLIEKMGAYPTIFFVNSRKEAEEYARNSKNFVTTDFNEIEEREKFCEKYYEIFPYIKDNEILRDFISKGVAPHHAGLIPALKIIIEDALKIGIAKFVFATKTLASGIDVPAKSVVITNQKTFDGARERLLLPSEVFQIAGRAGRRGKDKVGYVFISAPITQMTKELFKELENIRSSFYINPHLVLNLLKKFETEECVSFIRKSLKFFEVQSNFEKWRKKFENKMNKLEKLNAKFLEIKPENIKCSIQTNVSFRNTKENIKESENRKNNLLVRIKILKDVADFLSRTNKTVDINTLFSDHQHNIESNIGKTFLAIDQRRKLGILKIEKTEDHIFFSFSTREGKKYTNKWRFIMLCPVEDNEEFVNNEILIHFQEKQNDLLQMEMKITKLIHNTEKIVKNIDIKNKNREAELIKFPCDKCPVFEECSKISEEIKTEIEKIEELKRENPDSVEKEFRATLEFLKRFGYIDEKNILTEKGWEASKLKNPRSIYIFEALERGFFGNSPEDFAATMSLVLSEPKPPFKKPPKGIEEFFTKIYTSEIEMGLQPKIIPTKLRNGKLAFLDGKIYIATYMWAKGATIEEIEEQTEIEPGDFSRNIVQTVEVLRQIENMENYRYIAQEAIGKIYRSPISDFVE